jgi:hypothetical protein
VERAEELRAQAELCDAVLWCGARLLDNLAVDDLGTHVGRQAGQIGCDGEVNRGRGGHFVRMPRVARRRPASLFTSRWIR